MSDFSLTDIAAQTVEELEAEGVKLSAQDVLTIQKLSLDVWRGPHDTGDLARGKPVELTADEWLWPITLAGDAFFRDYPDKSEKDQLLALAYACRFGADEERIYQRGREAVKAVRAWSRKLRVTITRIGEVLERLVGEPEVPSDPVSEQDRKVCASLVATALVGGEPKTWELACSAEGVASVIDLVLSQKLAEHGVAKGEEHLVELKRLTRFQEHLRTKNGRT